MGGWVGFQGVQIAKHMRIGFGASYRYVYGLDLKNTKSDALDGFTTNLTLKLGKF